MGRMIDAWRALSAEQRLAAAASLGLFVAMFLPWYQQNAVAQKTGLESRNLDAFQVFSFVEAAVLLVSVSVCFMLFARGEGRQFQLPGGDGVVVLAAGLWAALLLVLRLFDKPGISSNGVAANVGVQWGIFFALGAAGLLAYAGQRMRRPHGPRHHVPATRPRRAPVAEEPPTAQTEVRPSAEQTKVRAPAEPRPAYPPAPATAAGRGPRRGDAPEQLSFEEPPPSGD
jgi:hypothetical protein